MDVLKTQTLFLQNVIYPTALQSFWAEICSQALRAVVPSALAMKGSCGTSTAFCMTNSLLHGESRQSIGHRRKRECNSSLDTDEEGVLDKCVGSILDNSPVPEVTARVSQHHFSEWLLAAKNKDDEEEDEDEEDDEDDVEGDDEDDEGDDEEGDDDEEGGEGEGEEGEGDDEDEDDEADDDDDEEEEDEDEDGDEDELPPKKLKK